VLAEIALALHPILIKQIPVGLTTQLLARLGTYTVLGTAMSGEKDRQLSWGNWSNASKSIVFGLMNILHIGASYVSYQNLPAGSALALFYTYPFFNILAGVLFLGDPLDIKIFPLLVMAFAGVLLISKYTENTEGFTDTSQDSDSDSDSTTSEDSDSTENSEDFTEKAVKSIPLGIAAALISSITETLIFLVAKTGGDPSPWLPILKLYPAAFAGILGWIAVSGASWKTSVQNWIPLLLFNVFIGFLGYSLRFWSIPRLPTAIFSILTFIGVAAGYGWGLAYAKEVPTAGALAGAGLITGALGLLKATGL
jgi:drug/metabolite transporter (DMT)-like permease